MDITPLHSWNVTPKEGVQLQRELAGRVDARTPLAGWKLAAGADVSHNRFDPTFYVSVVLYRTSDGRVVETADVVRRVTFPYVPGLLSFREAPALLDAFAELKQKPDAVIIDGHGLAHPRRLGIASHIGLWLNVPTLGCGKSLLCGTYREPRLKSPAMTRLMHRHEQIGYVVRSKSRVKPVFVSVGHRIDLASSVRLVLATTRGYRLPEPTRLAHLRVNELRRRATGGVPTESV